MKNGSYIPERGDVIWIDFTPQRGHEQRGRRPSLVVSPKIYNEKTSLCICVPVTSKIKDYPFEVALPQEFEINGVILADQIKSLDFQARKASFIAKVPHAILQKVQNYMRMLIEG